ncbi:helix-turn-helix domain-containing protein [Clostridium sp. JN-9]|uniref:helix-turn-helix domain-containing protein n=1 Tax=Clostridium sp. JN-9 TaxID=2507159 RepID=UPI000FFE16F2|nr:helix-turn-helix domain-containing protein [Clostridium sp. JN-9]QAT40992.1 helix-turn-helix domain-containing protein [Clostridium sp. JN-9]
MNNFTMIPNEIMSNKNISHGAFKLYCILNSYCYGSKDTCFPSQNTLAQRMNKCIRTIQRYLKELIENGIIIIKRRGSVSNLYQLLTKAAKKAKQTAASLFGKSPNKNPKSKNKVTPDPIETEEEDEFKDCFYCEEEKEYFRKIKKHN